MFRKFVGLGAAALLTLGIAGCGDPDDPGGGGGPIDGKADGYDDTFSIPEGSREPINDANDPRRWREQMEYNWDVLSQDEPQGAPRFTPWAENYAAYASDGYNVRWLNSSTLSAVELYDAVFHDWDVPENIFELTRFRAHGTWDQEYYDEIEDNAPTTWWAHDEGGLGRARNAYNTDGTIKERYDADQDGVMDEDHNNDGETDHGDDLMGIESWWGHCHAWAPAAFAAPEPENPVTRGDHTFNLSDMRYLAMMTLEGGQSVFLGARCNARDIERDENGRVVDAQEECRDTNAGAFHIITTNVVGRMERSYVADVTQGYQVWNQPIRDYTITRQDEVDEATAVQLIGREGTEYPADINANAERFVHVEMTWRYIVESHESTEATVPQIENRNAYTRTKNLEYLLELAADGTIIGGEWIDTEMPDFLWAPVPPTNCTQEQTDAGACFGHDARSRRTYRTVVSVENVRDLIMESRDSNPEPPPEPEPEPMALTCAEPALMEFGQTYTGNTTGAASDITASCAGGANSPNHVYRLVMEEAGIVEIFLQGDNGNDYDTSLHIQSSCGDAASEIACNDDYNGHWNESHLHEGLEAGTYFVIVDGYSGDNSGDYHITANYLGIGTR